MFDISVGAKRAVRGFLSGTFLALVLLSVSSGAHAVGKMHIFSAVNGTVVRKGGPVSGAEVIREFDWAWGNEKKRETVLTDSEGKFYFPEVVRSSILGSILPHEPHILQSIYINHEGKAWDAWLLSKRNYRQFGELDRPVVIICDLDSPKTHHGKVYGICEPK